MSDQSKSRFQTDSCLRSITLQIRAGFHLEYVCIWDQKFPIKFSSNWKWHEVKRLDHVNIEYYFADDFRKKNRHPFFTEYIEVKPESINVNIPIDEPVVMLDCEGVAEFKCAVSIPFTAITEVTANSAGVHVCGMTLESWQKESESEFYDSSRIWYLCGEEVDCCPRDFMEPPEGFSLQDWTSLLREHRFIRHHTTSDRINGFNFQLADAYGGKTDFIDLVAGLPDHWMSKLSITSTALDIIVSYKK